jgi:hypothetical protein
VNRRDHLLERWVAQRYIAPADLGNALDVDFWSFVFSHCDFYKSELSEIPGNKMIAENKFLNFTRASKGEFLDLHPNIWGFLWGHVCAAMGVK